MLAVRHAARIPFGGTPNPILRDVKPGIGYDGFKTGEPVPRRANEERSQPRQLGKSEDVTVRFVRAGWPGGFRRVDFLCPYDELGKRPDRIAVKATWDGLAASH